MTLPHLYSGKVRDVFDAGDGLLLMVASDRISAFDKVFAEPVPDKGRVLTAMTAFWATELEDLSLTHLVATDPAAFPEAANDIPGFPPEMSGGPRHARAACRDAAHRMHRARLSLRLGLEGVPDERDDARHRPAGRSA